MTEAAFQAADSKAQLNELGGHTEPPCRQIVLSLYSFSVCFDLDQVSENGLDLKRILLKEHEEDTGGNRDRGGAWHMCQAPLKKRQISLKGSQREA